MSVQTWLESHGFDESIIQLFEENEIDMDVMRTLSEGDLREIGVTSFGIRRKLSIELKLLQVEPPDEDDTMSNTSSAESTLSESPLPKEPLASSTPSTSLTPPTPSTPCTPSTSSSGSKPTFTKPDDFQVKKILEASHLGKSVLEGLEAGLLTISSRKKLVQVLVAYLIEQVGSNYPTGPQKLALARAIVNQYPCTKDVMPGTEGHAHFYSNGHGFIEYRLKTIRASQAPHLKKRTQSKKRKASNVEAVEEVEDGETTAEILEKVEFLKYHPPVPENKTMLKTYFKDTHKYRQKRLKTNLPSVTEILTDWPRLRDMPELINLDFDLLFPTGSEFLSKWHPQFTPKILQVAKSQKKANLDNIISRYVDGDDDLCSLELLVNILRTTNFRKTVKGKGSSSASASTVDAVSYLIQNKMVGTDVDQWCKDKLKKYSQPFLLGLGPATKPTQYFIICDSTNIPVGDSIMVAFDRLFKLHYVLNLHFALPLLTFYNFFEGLIYRVVDQDKINPQVSMLMGFAWIFGMLADFTKVDVLWWFFYLSYLVQAILIFIFFGLSSRTRKMWRSSTATSTKMTSGIRLGSSK